MKNIKDTIMSQYANSPVILSIINEINDAIDPSQSIDDFFYMVFQLSTASGYGLDNWGRIVGVDRTVKLDDPEARTFGFFTDPLSDFYSPFDVDTFSASGSNLASYQLSDDFYRRLIITKAALNIIYATAPNINKFLSTVFRNKRVYYLITGHMTATYYFEFFLDSFERLIAYTLDFLPKPSGVLISYQEINPDEYFGFFEADFQPFDVGILYND